MTGRLKLMLAALTAIALLLVLDRPRESTLEVVEGAPRAAPVAAHDTVPPPAPVAPLDAPIPDLFAAEEAAAPAAAAAAAADAPPAEPAQRPAKPFTLIGFRQEGALREAWLMRGDTVAAVRAGDLLDQRYRVLALGGDSVDIKDKQSGASFRIGFEDHQ